MATNSEIYRAADLLIKEFGELAAVGAVVKVDQFEREGNVEGHAVWTRILKAVEELLDDDLPQGTQVN
ncbi:MAG: hypothetical protein EXQ86_02335 [Rhodospirillales bacterium]|nr:hypothetical protein [Rhodospirillales bacterium]